MRAGRSLRELNSVDLFEAAYALMEERSLVDEEMSKARNKFRDNIRDIVLEDETGIPAAVRRFGSADASQYAGGGDN